MSTSSPRACNSPLRDLPVLATGRSRCHLCMYCLKAPSYSPAKRRMSMYVDDPMNRITGEHDVSTAPPSDGDGNVASEAREPLTSEAGDGEENERHVAVDGTLGALVRRLARRGAGSSGLAEIQRVSWNGNIHDDRCKQGLYHRIISQDTGHGGRSQHSRSTVSTKGAPCWKGPSVSKNMSHLTSERRAETDALTLETAHRVSMLCV